MPRGGDQPDPAKIVRGEGQHIAGFQARGGAEAQPAAKQHRLERQGRRRQRSRQRRRPIGIPRTVPRIGLRHRAGGQRQQDLRRPVDPVEGDIGADMVEPVRRKHERQLPRVRHPAAETQIGGPGIGAGGAVFPCEGRQHQIEKIARQGLVYLGHRARRQGGRLDPAGGLHLDQGVDQAMRYGKTSPRSGAPLDHGDHAGIGDPVDHRVQRIGQCRRNLRHAQAERGKPHCRAPHRPFQTPRQYRRGIIGDGWPGMGRDLARKDRCLRGRHRAPRKSNGPGSVMGA